MIQMQNILEKLQSNRQSAALIVFLAIVEIGIHLWTFVHNATLLSRGVTDDARVLAIVAAATGEVFSVGSLVLTFQLAGKQRKAALGSHIAAFLVLLLNTGISDAMTRGVTLPSWLQFYADHLAAVFIFAVVSIGVYVIAHFDPNAVLRTADLEVASARVEGERIATLAIQQAILAELATDPSVANTLSNATSAIVKSIVGSVTSRVQRSSPRDPSPRDPARSTSNPTAEPVSPVGAAQPRGDGHAPPLR